MAPWQQRNGQVRADHPAHHHHDVCDNDDDKDHPAHHYHDDCDDDDDMDHPEHHHDDDCDNDDLTKKHLSLEIQNQETSHDAKEDTLSALDLMKMKLTL